MCLYLHEQMCRKEWHKCMAAEVSVLLFREKTPWKLCQLSSPKLIQDFYKSLERKRAVVLHFHLFFFCCYRVNTFDLLFADVKHKVDSYSNFFMTGVYRVEWAAFLMFVFTQNPAKKSIDWRSSYQ